jgi:hypothetical protein
MKAKATWLSSISPRNVARVAKGIGWLVGTASRASDSISLKIRDNRARDKISDAIADRVAMGIKLEDPRFERAFLRDSNRLLGEQQSLDEIAERTAELLEGKLDSDFSASELDDDWLYQYEMAAKSFSSERMKEAFSRILAGEILKPGSFSPATLKVLTTMDQRSAKLFRIYAALAWNTSVMAPRVLRMDREVGSNQLAEFGLWYSDVNHLREYGLVGADINTWQEVLPLGLTLAGVSIGKGRYRLSHSARSETPQGPIRLHGIPLTSVGRELFAIAEPDETPPKYIGELKEWLLKTHRITLSQ